MGLMTPEQVARSLVKYGKKQTRLFPTMTPRRPVAHGTRACFSKRALSVAARCKALVAGVVFDDGPQRVVSRLQETEQLFVDLILQGRAHAVRRALVDLERGILDNFG
jgi:hypothetical protein